MLRTSPAVAEPSRGSLRRGNPEPQPTRRAELAPHAKRGGAPRGDQLPIDDHADAPAFRTARPCDPV